MTDQQVSRYLYLVSRLAYIHAHSGVDWRPEYGPELEAVRAELTALKPLVKTEIQSKTALVPSAPVKTTMVMGKDLRTGAVEVAEYEKQVPGQMVMGEDGKAFDPMTGEISEPEEKKSVRLVRAE